MSVIGKSKEQGEGIWDVGIGFRVGDSFKQGNQIRSSWVADIEQSLEEYEGFNSIARYLLLLHLVFIQLRYWEILKDII